MRGRIPVVPHYSPQEIRRIRRTELAFVAAFVALLLGAACATATESEDKESLPSTRSFSTKIDNPYFPLLPGEVHRLEGKTPDGNEVATITVTDRFKVVDGVKTRVVHDVTRLNGELAEKTSDYFAQDSEGNVWYFGEVTADYENGKVVSRSGAFEAGKDGAEGGIAMVANPQVSDAFRIEHDPGNAMDMAWVVETGLQAQGFDDVIRVLEWSPLERGVVTEKRYARGVGLVYERALAGGAERFELVGVK